MPVIPETETLLNLLSTPRYYASSTHKNDADKENMPPKPSLSELKEKVTSPFRKALFWPGESQCKKKKRVTKVRLPSAVTSEEWKQYYQQIEDKKIKDNIEKENRKRQREINAKLKKEKDDSKFSKKKKRNETEKDEIVQNDKEDDQLFDDIAVSELASEITPPPPLKLDLNNLQVNQWVVVPYYIGKFNKTYIGKILDVDHAHKCATVRFLEKKSPSHKYVWPKTNSTDLVPFSKFSKLLKEPTFDRWGNLTFGDE